MAGSWKKVPSLLSRTTNHGSGGKRKWIGVDLDGTLAQYHGWKGAEHIGHPVPAMLSRVKAWLDQGTEVRIFTARVSRRGERRTAIRAIGDWCEQHGLPRLPVTNVKDFEMIELWDDRAVRVETNVGKRTDERAPSRRNGRGAQTSVEAFAPPAPPSPSAIVNKQKPAQGSGLGPNLL